MSTKPQFTKREKEIIKLLLQGLSNKQIAFSLSIQKGTVEYHLTNIYAKLSVSSRAEAILALQTPSRNSFIGTNKILISIGVLITIVLAFALWYFFIPKHWKFERECERPNESTVGQLIQRSQASGKEVHGQFGTVDSDPYPPQAGYVIYTNIDIPQIDQLSLKLKYSKFSPFSVHILVYLDDEPDARAAISLVNQGDWNKFVWTDPIDLGSIEGGIHTLKFYTEGQDFGVADLDKLVLTEEVQ
jgi:DNA-binding CsgD family transcriptional regulator